MSLILCCSIASFDIEYIAVVPSRDIVSCHQFVGVENWKMGNVFKDKLVNQNVRKRFLKPSISFEKVALVAGRIFLAVNVMLIFLNLIEI